MMEMGCGIKSWRRSEDIGNVSVAMKDANRKCCRERLRQAISEEQEAAENHLGTGEFSAKNLSLRL